MAKSASSVKDDVFTVLLVVTFLAYVLGIVWGAIYLDRHYLTKFAVPPPPSRRVVRPRAEREVKKPVEPAKKAPRKVPGAGDLEID